MPRYELMYIVASSVSDDQIPTVTDGVLKMIDSLGGKVIKEEQMGKKKLAYPVKKTRNGFYSCVNFDLDSLKVNELDAKIRASDGIIRHLVVNMEEGMRRMEKDALTQEKMNRNRAARKDLKSETTEIAETPESIDQRIEEALSEDLKNI